MRLERPTKIGPRVLLESWEQGVFPFAWDNTVNTDLNGRIASEGRRGLQLNFDLQQCPWPVLSIPGFCFDPSQYQSVAMDVYLPPSSKGKSFITSVFEASQKIELPTVRLKSGWNTVNTVFAGLDQRTKSDIRSVQWIYTSDSKERGSVIFDNFRGFGSSNGPPHVIDSWERPCLWKVLDESVHGELDSTHASVGQRGAKVSFDAAESPRPMLLSRLNPPWNLQDVHYLAVDIWIPEMLKTGVAFRLGLRSAEVSYLSSQVYLNEGWNQVRVGLAADDWLPRKARNSIEQIELRLIPARKDLKGFAVFDNLRSE
jgi:hypothetical protein